MMFDYFVGICRIGRIIFETAGLPDARLLPFLRGLSLIGTRLVIRPVVGRIVWRSHSLPLCIRCLTVPPAPCQGSYLTRDAT
jgi:hypothetical protein